MANEFTRDQLMEIEEGKRQGVNVSLYANKDFLAIQMRQIRLGLVDRLPVELYADKDYDWFQMEEIRLGLKSGVDVSKYADKDIDFDVMREIRLGFAQGIDLSFAKKYKAGIVKQIRLAEKAQININRFIKDGYDENQLNEIRIALEKGINIEKYITKAYRGASIREIALGLEMGLDVSNYALPYMNWQQMREIRLGLEKRLDVSAYQNKWYSWQQMREIRLGLEMGFDVSKYSSLMYSPKAMQKKRYDMLDEIQNNEKVHAFTEIEIERLKNQEHDGEIFDVMISEDKMNAYVLILQKNQIITKAQILDELQKKNVVSGINNKAIADIEDGNIKSDMILVATGKQPEKGDDGWYEYLFKTDNSVNFMADDKGNVNYKEADWFERVEKDDTVAYYHDAKLGVAGYKVTGEIIKGIKGKDLPLIQGEGIKLLEDSRTYVAKTSGKIELRDGKIIISEILELKDVTRNTGKVEFDGSIHIAGTVLDGVVIKATKDVLIDGFVEGITIEAGGDVILKKGNNSGGKGHIKAEGDVIGSFFENADIIAGNDIKANYCLNSKINAKRDIVITGKFGALAGGEAVAGRSIISYNIGNDAGINTRLKIGRELNYLQDKKDIEDKKKATIKELTLLKHAYTDYQSKYNAEERNVNPLFLKLESAIYSKENEVKALDEELQQLMDSVKNNEEAKAKVTGTIYNGVLVEINGAKWRSTELANVTLKKKDEQIVFNKN